MSDDPVILLLLPLTLVVVDVFDDDVYDVEAFECDVVVLDVEEYLVSFV